MVPLSAARNASPIGLQRMRNAIELGWDDPAQSPSRTRLAGIAHIVFFVHFSPYLEDPNL